MDTSVRRTRGVDVWQHRDTRIAVLVNTSAKEERHLKTQCGIKCIDGKFSDGNSTSCLPHTRCGEGQQQIKPGTQSTDSECGEPSKALLWLNSIPIVLITVFILMLCVCYRKKKKSMECNCSKIDGKVETYFERGPQQR
ncbi:unnamed protein product [Gadus morhua 'NCC']